VTRLFRSDRYRRMIRQLLRLQQHHVLCVARMRSAIQGGAGVRVILSKKCLQPTDVR